jgi:hypothetical protein
MHSSSKILEAIFFPKESRVKDRQPITAEEIYTVLELIMHMGFASKLSVRLYFSLNKLVAMPMCGSFISMDRFESTSCFKYYTSKDTHEGPQELFKIYPKFKIRAFTNTNMTFQLMKGGLSFKLYFSLRTCEMCKSISGYL